MTSNATTLIYPRHIPNWLLAISAAALILWSGATVAARLVSSEIEFMQHPTSLSSSNH